MKFRQWLMRTMAGRYGVDQLNKALLWTYLACAVAAIFFEPFYFATFALLVWMFFRIFSRNIYKRQSENQKYLRLIAKPRAWITLQQKKFADRKTHRYRTCPHCKATLRLPNRKGRHTVCCPKCKKDFEVRI